MDAKEMRQVEQIVETAVAPLRTDVAELKTDVAELKTNVAGLQTNVAGLQANYTSLDKRMMRMEIMLENDISRMIQLLYEGQQDIVRRLDKITQCDDHEERIGTLEAVVSAHSRQIIAIEDRAVQA